MLSTLIRFSIKFYGIIIALAILLVGYGGYRFSTAGLDIFPEFSPKQVIIQTESPGLSVEQVELLVTQPIENNLAGLNQLKFIRSESIQGLSVVTAIFAESTDNYRNRQLVTERLNAVSNQLPPNIAAPVAVPLSSSSATVLTLGLSSDSDSLMDLRRLVDWTIVPRLLAVPGVADVNVFGGEQRQLQIQIDPVQLRRFNLSVEDIISAARQAGQIQASGFIENSNQRLGLQMSELSLSPEQFKKIIIKSQPGSRLTLGDVCTVTCASAPAIGAAQIMGKPGIVMMVIAQFGANTLTVSRQVEQRLGEFKRIFKTHSIDFYPHLFRPADYIETSLSNLSGHLLIGGIFVVLVLYLFLFNIRSAFIAACAIPVSLMTAMLVLLEAGVNLNIMVLGGLAIALGEVVDDAIIDTENIFRRLRENRLLAVPEPVAHIVLKASLEVRSSVVYASFIVALAFVPLLTLPGVAGRLFSPLGVSYILAILMSLLVALTLTPALCYLLLGQSKPSFSVENDPPLIQYLKPHYQAILIWVNHHFKGILLLSIVFCLFAGLGFSQLNNKFLPELREGHYIVHTTSMPGTSLQESIRIGTALTQQFIQIDGIESVSQWAGRAERGADTFGSHYSEYEIRLLPASGAKQQQILEQLRRILDAFPGIVYEANTFLTERVDETLSGYTSPLVVNIFGQDLAKLDQMAQAISRLMTKLPGISDVQIRSPATTPILQIQLDWTKLNHYGVNPEAIIRTLNTAYNGQVTGQIIKGSQTYPVTVTLRPDLKTQVESLMELPVRTQQGHLISLGQLISRQQIQGRYNILHQHGQRKQTVTAHIVNRDMNQLIQHLKDQIFAQINFPANYYPELTGAAIEQAQAKQDLILHALLAAMGALLFIYLAMRSLRHVLLTLVNLPFALIGGIAAVILTHASLSVGSMVGFITLFGITVRNSIMLLSHYQYLVTVEGRQWNLETLISGAQQRLPSILMTAIVTALAMLPIAMNSDNPGREIMGPMATIIIGGLVSSTLLNLLLLPNILLYFGRFSQTKPSETL